MLLLHRTLKYCMIVLIKFTHKYVDYLNVNFNKMLTMFILQQSNAHIIYIPYTSHKHQKRGQL